MTESNAENSRLESDNSPLIDDLDSKVQLAKLLSDALDKHIKVVKKKETMDENGSPPEEQDGIFLFSSSKALISSADLEREALRSQEKLVQKKPKFKRRKIDDTDSEDESSKLQSVAVSYDWVVGSKY